MLLQMSLLADYSTNNLTSSDSINAKILSSNYIKPIHSLMLRIGLQLASQRCGC